MPRDTEPDFAAVDAIDAEPLPEAQLTGPLTRLADGAAEPADPEPQVCSSCGDRYCRGQCAPGGSYGARVPRGGTFDPWGGL